MMTFSSFCPHVKRTAQVTFEYPPGMFRCLSKDIFEGVLLHNVALYLNYFLYKKKWFTYSILNRQIIQVK